jgi:hypothetical protein
VCTEGLDDAAPNDMHTRQLGGGPRSRRHTPQEVSGTPPHPAHAGAGATRGAARVAARPRAMCGRPAWHEGWGGCPAGQGGTALALWAVSTLKQGLAGARQFWWDAAELPAAWPRAAAACSCRGRARAATSRRLAAGQGRPSARPQAPQHRGPPAAGPPAAPSHGAPGRRPPCGAARLTRRRRRRWPRRPGWTRC